MKIILYGISCNQNMSLNSERLKCPPLPHLFTITSSGFMEVYASRPHTLGSASQRFTETEYFPWGHRKPHLSLSYGCLSITSTSVPRNQQRKGVYAAGIIDSGHEKAGSYTMVVRELHDACDPQMMWNVWNVSWYSRPFKGEGWQGHCLKPEKGSSDQETRILRVSGLVI